MAQLLASPAVAAEEEDIGLQQVDQILALLVEPAVVAQAAPQYLKHHQLLPQLLQVLFIMLAVVAAAVAVVSEGPAVVAVLAAQADLVEPAAAVVLVVLVAQLYHEALVGVVEPVVHQPQALLAAMVE